MVDIDVTSEFNAMLGNVIAGDGVGLILDGVAGRAVARDRGHVKFDFDQ